MERNEMMVQLPEGCFMGNCVDCRYADWSEERDGMIWCTAPMVLNGGWVKPSSRYGCSYYKYRP